MSNWWPGRRCSDSVIAASTLLEPQRTSGGHLLRILDQSLRFGHYRASDGVEVDLVIENDQNEVFAVEVKAGGSYRGEDLRGLVQLRDRVGDRFVAGVLAYTGERAARVADRLYLVPVDTLWREPEE
ncbi:DUF4143 domain-containing protein [Frankia sp. Cas3]|uniref:DUF4143 domain-containing protein n=1 Tax=Frankia sp. Cas3 TaxID=3073926 RepID=UPI003A0FD7A6